jgi:hypothetical protein
MKKFIFSALLVIPSAAFAQVLGPLGATVTMLQNVVMFLVPIMMALAVLVFLWGLVRFIANATDEDARASGKALMVWGMVALFILVTFWGIIGFVQESLGLSGVIVSDPPPTLTFGS